MNHQKYLFLINCMRVFFTSLVIVTMSISCSKREDNVAKESIIYRQNIRGEELLNETEVKFQSYLTGDLNTARQSLREIIQILEECEGVSPNFRAANLFIECSRLFALETRAGNEDAANAALIMLRYWHLKRQVLTGQSLQEAIETVETDTPEKVVEMIEQEGISRGEQPNYIKELIQNK